MRSLPSWFVRATWLAFGVALAFLAWPHFADGVAADSAIPAPNYMILERAMPHGTYEYAATALSGTNPRNGMARIAAAEASLLSGAPGAHEIAALKSALAQSPASPRGWLLLSEASTKTAPSAAALAISEALLLAPYDYWIAGARARQAALLWPRLDADTQARALAQTRLLWDEPPLRPQLITLLQSRAGAELVSRSFQGDRRAFVALNRWVSAWRRVNSPAP